MPAPHHDRLNVIITGATGMVGEGVLDVCLRSDSVAGILVVGRKACGWVHPKLREIICPDFMDLSAVESHLAGYNACFFCMGVSSVGMKEQEYIKLTHSIALNMAGVLSRLNPGMVFCYISGAGTDSTEKGRLMWARVKGKTENDLMKLPFKAVYNFRPAILKPTPGLKNTLGFYKYIGWLIPLVKWVAPNAASSLEELGSAMIRAATQGYEKPILEVSDILKLAGEIR